jgi:hypothetical protein
MPLAFMLQAISLLSFGQPSIRPAEAGARSVVVSGDAVICGDKHAQGQFEIHIARLSSSNMTVSVEMNVFYSQGQQCLVPEGDRLYIVGTYPARERLLSGGDVPEMMFCVSAADLSSARWKNVGPMGEEVVPTFLLAPYPWSRGLEEEPRRRVNSAFSAAPASKLYLFDARKPADGEMLGDIVVTEVTPVFDETKKNWAAPKEVVKEVIPKLSFTESFHPYHVDGDFYFVTHSGKVYSAPKPEMDSPRKLAEMKVPFSVRYVVDNSNGTYHLAGIDKEGFWHYAKLGR